MRNRILVLIVSATILIILSALAVFVARKDWEYHQAKAADVPKSNRYQLVSTSRMPVEKYNDLVTIIVVRDTATGKCQALSVRYGGPATPLGSETTCGAEK